MAKTVLLLGAGVSRAAGAGRSASLRPPLDADFFDVARLGGHRAYKPVSRVLEEFVGDYSTTLMQSLERATTYLYLKAIDSAAGSIYHKGFLQLLSLLSTVLGSTTNPLSVGRRSLLYRFLLSELSRLDSPEDMTIITFNYDLLVEKSLDEIAKARRPNVFQFPNCYRLEEFESVNRVTGQTRFSNSSGEYEGVAVLKLHGSMNWLSRHTSNEPRPSTLFAQNREIHLADSPLIATNLSWRRRLRTIYMKPIIVPPVSGKRGMMHKVFSSLWEKAGAALREADRIVIAGYSCPPLDIEARILLSENLRLNSDKKLYLIDPNAESAAKFIDLCGVGHSTIYSSLKSWVADAK